MDNEKNKKNAKKTNALIVTIVASVLIVCCVVFVAYNAYKKYDNNKLIDGVKNSSTVSLAPIAQSDSDVSTDTTVLVENPINFKDLQEKNDDLYAWIYVPNTKVDHPVAQSGEGEDDSFYLHHGVDKGYYFAGTIYSEKKNSKDFTDRNTLLYGHNMLDDSMFTTLHNFEDEDFFKKNKYIYIYTPGHILTYEVFAAYEYDDRHILNSFDFSDDDVWADYIEQVTNAESVYTCNVRKDVEVTTDDKILTLSTCTDYRPNNRYLVQGVLVDDQLTK